MGILTNEHLKGRKELSAEIKKYLLSINKNDISVSLFIKLFNRHLNKKLNKLQDPIVPRMSKMTLKKGEYINKEDIVTTPGIFIANKILVEGFIDDIIETGYYNKIITGDELAELGSYFFKDYIALYKKSNGNVDTSSFIKKIQMFIYAEEFFGLKNSSFLCPSYTKGLINPIPEVIEKKNKLIKESNKENKKLSLAKMVEIEDELVSMAREKLKNDRGMTLYDSKSRGKFENNYKNNLICVGPTYNPSTGEYEFISSNYIDGISKSDLAKAGNLPVNGAYPRAVGTQVGGTMTKQFYAAYQSIIIGEKGSDCGSKSYLPVLLTKKNYKDHLFQYIIDEKGNLIELTEESVSKYIGKIVHKRSPMFCIGESLCNVCAGNRFEIFNMKNAGGIPIKISNGLMNKNMKAFHVTKITMHKVDVNTLLI